MHAFLYLHSFSVAGGFRWKDGSPVDYTNWAPGEPSDKDGKAGENCVELYLQSDWNDIVCDVKRGYICQVKQGNVFALTPQFLQPDSFGGMLRLKHIFF